jgi:hypothetical protein
MPRMENQDFPCMSFLIPYLFYCDKSIIIEEMPSLMHKNDFLNNTRVIGGKFDISKWYRPIEYAFEIIDDKVPLIIKRGDPLYYIRFITDKDVNLIQTYEYENNYVQKFSSNCVNIKNFIKGNTLQKNYSIVSDYLESIKKKIFPKKSKCPFHFFKKDKDE